MMPLRKLVLAGAVALTLAGVSASAAEARDPAPCGAPVDKGYPTGWVQYCTLYGASDAWVPVYRARYQGRDAIGTDIVGWLTRRDSVNWFWCQTTGADAIYSDRESTWWAKTVTDIEPGPPYREQHVQGWVSETYFANEILGYAGNLTQVDRDSGLRIADC